MPIGGGTFTVQNKILPGAYINFVSLGSVVKMGTRGVAALPLELNWGPEGQVFKLDLVMASVIILSAVAALMYQGVVLLQKLVMGRRG